MTGGGETAISRVHHLAGPFLLWIVKSWCDAIARLKIALSVENNQKIITLFATDKAIFNAPYKITCKDKVICNRLGYLQSLQITPSLENSPISDSHKIWSQQVTGSSVANKRLPPHFTQLLHTLASIHHPHTSLPATGPRPLQEQTKPRWRTTQSFWCTLFKNKN